MKEQRFSFKAKNSKDENILVAMELNIKDMDVDIITFPLAKLSEDKVKEFMKEWDEGKVFDTMPFPIEKEEKRSFANDSFLPDDIKVDNYSGLVRQKQNEWSYLLLSEKLYEQFNTELDMLKEKAAELTEYDHELYKENRDFWEKLIEYKKEKEISQEKLNYFKEEVNTIFDKLKILKESYQKELDDVSQSIQDEFMKKIDALSTQLEEKDVHFKSIIEEIKKLQAELKDKNIKRSVKNSLYDNMQKLFETVISKRSKKFGSQNNNRIEGLKQARDKIQRSIDYDKKDLKYNEEKVKVANNKLEEQLREAKLNVLRDKIASKQAKVNDIEKTILRLEDKAEKINKDENNPKIEDKKDEIDSSNDEDVKKVD